MEKKINFLPDSFNGTGEVAGHIFDKVSTSPNYYIFKVCSPETKERHYEVIKRLITPICINFEERLFSETEFKETYPKSARWGVDGFTFKDYSSAFNKVESLEEAIKTNNG